MHQLTTFDNGLRLITVTMPHAYSVSMGLYVATGSRYESPEQAGLSHFVEHMLFKGTERRPTPRELAMAVERLGGSLNASTGRESTAYYARVSRDDLPVAADVLVDMFLNSRLADKDVERECQVILEELAEAHDTPDDLVMMNFHEQLWPDHPLGWDIAGYRESVRAVCAEDVRGYLARRYSPRNTVIAIAGAATHDEARALVEPLLGQWQGQGEPTPAPPAPTALGRRVRVVRRPIEQVHLLVGCRGISRFDPDRHALSLLDTILSDGMSSRLFIDIREERGLAYSVYSYLSTLSDTGLFAVYAAVDPNRTQETLTAVLGHLHRLREEPVSAEELGMAKSLARGRMMLRLEHTGANAGWVGNQLALRGTVRTPEEILAQLDAVTAEELQQVARRLFRDEALLLSLVGPLDEDQSWAEHLRVE